MATATTAGAGDRAGRLGMGLALGLGLGTGLAIPTTATATVLRLRRLRRRGYVNALPGDWAVVKTDVSPEEARVFLDGSYIGTADDFDGCPDNLYLKRGHYRLEFRLEGFETKTVDIDARPGTMLKIDDKLKKITGAKQYGSYDTPGAGGRRSPLLREERTGPDGAPATGQWTGQARTQRPAAGD